jgi:hypothetical protein
MSTSLGTQWPDRHIVCDHRPYHISRDTFVDRVVCSALSDFHFTFRGKTIPFQHGQWTLPEGVLDFCQPPDHQTWFSHVRDAVVTPSGVVWNGSPLRFHERFGEWYLSDDSLAQCMQTKVAVDGPVINTLQPHSWSYCHWIMEALPKILYSNALGLSGKLIVDDTGFARKACWILGISPDRLIFQKRNDPSISASNVAVWNGIPFEEISLEAIELIRHAFGVKDREGDIGILIDRAFKPQTLWKRFARTLLRRQPLPVAPRTLTNQADVLTAVRSSFKNLRWEVFSSHTSFEDMLSMFSRARVIIGPHGAGLTNMLFSPRSIPVVELISSGNPCNFLVLSHCLSNMHRCLAVATESAHKDSPMTVSPHTIIGLLKELLS